MNFSLRPHPLVAHWVPGFLFVVIIEFCYDNLQSQLPRMFSAPSTTNLAFNILAVVVIAFVVGQVFDAFRDVAENLLDKYLKKKAHWKVYWDFFFWGEQEQIDNLECWYYTYYVLDCNLCLAIAVALPFAAKRLHALPTFGLGVAFLIFLVNAGTLKREVAKLTQEWAKSHHRNLEG